MPSSRDPGRKIYDVSLTISPGMLVWPGDVPVSIESVKSLDRGDSSNLTALHMGAHSGTHVDAPRHFVSGGRSIDSLNPEVLVGQSRLLQLSEARVIDRPLLERQDLKGVTRLLLGTSNSALLHKPELDLSYVSVSEDGARYLVDMGVRLIGVDYLSIEEYHKEGHPTHTLLLKAGIVIIEGLDLKGVPSGDYQLMCLPLKIKDADGAPARVFLVES